MLSGSSNGYAYYVLTAIVEKGLVKLENFKKNSKGRYAYLLTPKGIREKSILTHNFIKRKRKEYEILKKDIEVMEEEAGFISSVKLETLNRDTAINHEYKKKGKNKLSEMKELSCFKTYDIRGKVDITDAEIVYRIGSIKSTFFSKISCNWL